MAPLRLVIYVSAAEEAVIKQLSNAATLSISSWCRRAVMDMADKERQRYLNIDPETKKPVPILAPDSMSVVRTSPFSHPTDPSLHFDGQNWVKKKGT